MGKMCARGTDSRIRVHRTVSRLASHWFAAISWPLARCWTDGSAAIESQWCKPGRVRRSECLDMHRKIYPIKMQTICCRLSTHIQCTHWTGRWVTAKRILWTSKIWKKKKWSAITLYELGYPTANMMNFRFVESTIFGMPRNGFIFKYLKCLIVFRTSSMAIAIFV